MRKLSNVRGLEIIHQGAQQYMAMGFEDSRGTPNCPFNPITRQVETKLWVKGYLEARFKWEKTQVRKKFTPRFTKRPFVKK